MDRAGNRDGYIRDGCQLAAARVNPEQGGRLGLPVDDEGSIEVERGTVDRTATDEQSHISFFICA